MTTGPQDDPTPGPPPTGDDRDLIDPAADVIDPDEFPPAEEDHA